MKPARVEAVESEQGTGDSKPETQSTSNRPTVHCPLFTALIIGYGNPLRGDDGFGWRAAELLAESLAGQDVEVITCHQLTPELAEPLSRSRRVVFIDADAEGKPGRIRRRVVRPLKSPTSAFTHSCTPSALLASAHQLYGRMPEAMVITVTAQSLEYGGSLSSVVSAALPKVVKQVRQSLGAHRRPPNQSIDQS